MAQVYRKMHHMKLNMCLTSIYGSEKNYVRYWCASTTLLFHVTAGQQHKSNCLFQQKWEYRTIEQSVTLGKSVNILKLMAKSNLIHTDCLIFTYSY